MSDKYIIRNCPAKYSVGASNMKCSELGGDCDTKTDCIMKQIVELCKEIKCPCEYKGADCWECTESGARRFADRILQLLDVQEVE